MNTIKSPLIVLTVLVVFFTSCSSTKSGIALKRKYTKGYYFAFGHNKKHTPVSDHITNKSEQEKAYPLVASNEKSSSVAIPGPKVKSLESVLAKESIGSEKKHVLKSKGTRTDDIPSANLNRETSSAKSTHFFSAYDKFSSTQKSTGSKKGGSDTNELVLIILCFFPFINLIAVYLKDGKQVTANFWVTLLLDILFFIPGIIFALLVVLDVVNLA